MALHVVEHANDLALIAGAAGIGALALGRAARPARVPGPALFLAAGAIVATVLHGHGRGPLAASDLLLLGTFLLVPILFDGGFASGWTRSRAVLAPVLVLGLPGTLLTAGLVAAAAHWVVGLSSHAAVLVGVALAPTDPAAVFSTLGDADVDGPTGALLEGESGWNDPVGISLMLAAVAHYQHASGAGGVAGEVVVQLLVGAAIGVAAGFVLPRVLERLAGVGAALGVLALASLALLTFGLAALAHGSGYLAVYLAGTLLGDATLRHRDSVARVVSAASGLAELAMFLALGLALPLSLLHGRSVAEGLAAFALLTFVVRPLVVGLLLVGWSGLRAPELGFVAWGGLKGAVPILLAALPVAAHLAGARHVFEVVFVAVAASVLVQGTTLPLLARRLGIVRTPA